MEFHLIPGHFSDAVARLLARLDAPLGELGEGESRQLDVRVRFETGRILAARLDAYGGRPSGAVYVGLAFGGSAPDGMTMKDVELGLLGLACAAMGGDDQGLVAMGSGLGPVAVGVPRGTLAEQGRALLDLHGAALEVLVACPDTATSLGDLEDFVREPLGDLVIYRRIGDVTVN